MVASKDIGQNQMVQTQQLRCANCNRFIGYQAILLGVVKIKCSACKSWTTIEILPEREDTERILGGNGHAIDILRVPG